MQLAGSGGEMGSGIPDLPTWRSLNKHLSPPLRFHDHRKALRRNVDGGSEVSRNRSQVPHEPKGTTQRNYCRTIRQRCSPSRQYAWFN